MNAAAAAKSRRARFLASHTPEEAAKARLKTKHLLVVEIECLDKQSHTEAQDRLVRWLETYGYTSPGHGFEFVAVYMKEETK